MDQGIKRSSGDIWRSRVSLVALVTMLCLTSGCHMSGRETAASSKAVIVTPAVAIPRPVAQSSERVGETGTLVDLSDPDVYHSSVPVAASEDAALRLYAAKIEEQPSILKCMAHDSQAFAVADGTAVHCTGGDFQDVTKYGATMPDGFAVVKILAGRHRGQSGWIPSYAFQVSEVGDGPATSSSPNRMSEPPLRPQLPLGYAEDAKKDDERHRGVGKRFSEQQRKAIYYTLTKADFDGMKESDRIIPEGLDYPTLTLQQSQEKMRLTDELQEKARRKLWREFRLSASDADALNQEAYQKGWPDYTDERGDAAHAGH